MSCLFLNTGESAIPFLTDIVDKTQVRELSLKWVLMLKLHFLNPLNVKGDSGLNIY